MNPSALPNAARKTRPSAGRLHWIEQFTPRTFQSAVLGVLLVAILVPFVFRGSLAGGFHESDSSDYLSYYRPTADHILNGEGIVDDDGKLAERYPPGFSFVLVGVFASAEAFGIDRAVAELLMTLLCSTSGAFFLFLLAELAWGFRGGWIAGILWGTYPFALWLMRQSNSELPFTVCLFAAVYLFARAMRSHSYRCGIAVSIGILCGLATLIRPIGLGFSGVLAASLLLRWSAWPERRQAWKFTCAMMLANLLVLLPWQLLLVSESDGAPLLSSNGTRSIVDGLTFGANPKAYRVDTFIPTRARDAMQMFASRTSSGSTLGEVGTAILRIALDEPVGLLELTALKAVRVWFATDSQRYELWTLALQIPYLFLIGLGLRAALRQGGYQGQLAATLLASTGYFWIMSFLCLSILRYMVPSMGLLLVSIPALFPRAMPMAPPLPSQSADQGDGVDLQDSREGLVADR